jgi:hypothetical protein
MRRVVASEQSASISPVRVTGTADSMGGDVDAGYLEAIPALDPVRAWIVEHDQSRVFLVLYIGLAVVLSLWISLFWLVAVVGAHLVLELIRQSHLQIGARRIVLESAWELKLDVALVLFALALSLYMETVLGVVGLQGAARLGSASRAAARFASWERVLRGVALSADDAAQWRFAAPTGMHLPPTPSPGRTPLSRQGGHGPGRSAPGSPSYSAPPASS